MIWIATVVSNVGTWMYNAACGWLMVSVNSDALLVSLVQIATSLPMFLFALAAGALADIFDKRRFLIVVESATTLLSGLFAALVQFGHVTPATLLLFTFLIGAAGASGSRRRIWLPRSPPTASASTSVGPWVRRWPVASSGSRASPRPSGSMH